MLELNIVHISTSEREYVRYMHMILQTACRCLDQVKWRTIKPNRSWKSSIFGKDNNTIKNMAIWKKATENMTFQSDIKMTCIKEVFDATKKGSKNYK